MDYYRLAAATEEPLQVFRQVASKLETPQQEQIMMIGEALVAQGMQEGMQQGMQQGMQRGRQAGETERAHTIATNLLHAGTEPDFVQRMTGLSPADMQRLLAEQ
jgi:predicted transposase YdaD